MLILMATGGSLHSQTALWLGAQIATQTSLPPTILMVIENEAGREQAQKVLQRAANIVARSGVEAQTIIRIGKPETEILAEAIEGDYDLLIIGERQLHSLKTRLVGSLPKRVLQKTPCSLLIAKGQIETIRHVLICDSGNTEHSALPAILESSLFSLIENSDHVTVLHVMSQISAGPGVQGEQLRANADELISAHAPEGEMLVRGVTLLNKRGIQPETKIRHGLVVDEILTEANGWDYDLVVIGMHATEGWSRYLLEDITAKVVEGIGRPVLVMR